ncbi:histidine phosphatase family protein [Tunturibacter empetritectus]|uniref:Broad specificity phosphatase PhoE n=1 Tax=Tunturiibacter empetritectus TaxID=3069691 RepID=A0A7W8IGT6_9BACT|nr:histidine phosphatase family protein [Edaphobacter lichenicola]MBB5315960.1 broad specificity phosphatase PhoE [Edaphobacter lichenicola]
MPARLTLISHAPTAATRLSAFPTDEPLEESVLSKLATLNWQPPRAQQILAAPELRTQQTAKALNLTTTPTNELRDLDYGIWQGRTLNDLYTEDPAPIALWLTDPTATPHKGESITALITRIGDWLTTLTVEDTIHTIAITHPAVIRAAILYTLNAPPQSFWRIDIAPLTLTDLRHNGRTWTLRASAIPLA